MYNMISFIIILLSIISYIIINYDITTINECKQKILKPNYIDNLDNLLASSNKINKAFRGEDILVLKNGSKLCYPNIDDYVEKDNVYLEIFQNYNKTNIIYNNFGNHITLHNIKDYGKNYKNKYILHKDQHLPMHNWLDTKLPFLVRWINLHKKHIICSCKGNRKILVVNDKCSYEINKDKNNLEDIGSPKPIYVKNKENILKNISKYEFLLLENECLFFNPYIQYHIIEGNEDNISQVHFFILGYLLPLTNKIIPFDTENEELKIKYNRNIYKMKYITSELNE